MSQFSLLLSRAIAGIKNIFSAPSTLTSVGTPAHLSGGQQVLQSARLGTASLSTGQSGRVLVSGAKVGGGVAIGGAGVGYGLTELSKPVTAFTEPIDSLVGFSGVGSIIIIGIIILVLIILLRRKI